MIGRPLWVPVFKATVRDSPKYYLITLYWNLLLQRHDGLIISTLFFHALIIQMNVLRGNISIEAMDRRGTKKNKTAENESVECVRYSVRARNLFNAKESECKTFECCTNDHYCWLNQHSCCLLHSRIARRCVLCTHHCGQIAFLLPPVAQQTNKQTVEM